MDLCFSAIFIKGNNFHDFLFASLDNNPLPDGVLLLKKKNLL